MCVCACMYVCIFSCICPDYIAVLDSVDWSGASLETLSLLTADWSPPPGVVLRRSFKDDLEQAIYESTRMATTGPTKRREEQQLRIAYE